MCWIKTQVVYLLKVSPFSTFVFCSFGNIIFQTPINIPERNFHVTSVYCSRKNHCELKSRGLNETLLAHMLPFRKKERPLPKFVL